MIPPMSIDAYPPNTVEGLIARKYVQMIEGCEDEEYPIPEAPIREVISRSRDVMRAAGWPATYQHLFLKRLRNDLTELTRCHPVTRQFITILDLELECN